MIGLLLLLGIGCACIWIWIMWRIIPNQLIIRQVELKGHISKELTLVQFSDLHIQKGFEKRTEVLISAIQSQSPDIILFTGDLFDSYERTPELHDEAVAMLKQLHASIGKIAVYGNHDIGGGALHIYREVMEDAGFIVLRNQILGLTDHGIAILGIDDSVAGYEDRTITRWRLQPYQILMSHEPDLIDQIDHTNVDLMISGHTHGGQIYLPMLSRKVLPKGGKHYRKGRYEIDHTTLYVSSGVGTTKLPLRFRNTPEIIVYQLRPISET